MDRRQLLLGGSVIATESALKIGQAGAQSPARRQIRNVVFDSNKPIPTLEEHRKRVADLTGAEFPYDAEIELGKKLLADIPTSGAPFRIAHRFHEWRQSKVGATAAEKKQYSYYAREWPVRGNPVIMQFFDATGLRNPRGDTTFWCSAFVSWCIQRSRTGAGGDPIWPYKEGAASSSYRSWGEKVDEPRQGDLAVFRRTDSSWAGHVGFVDRLDKVDGENVVWVLGGNQGAQNDYNGGEVNIAKYSRAGGGLLRLHSFRRHPALAMT